MVVLLSGKQEKKTKYRTNLTTSNTNKICNNETNVMFQSVVKIIRDVNYNL